MPKADDCQAVAEDITDIASIAQAVEARNRRTVSLINTLLWARESTSTPVDI